MFNFPKAVSVCRRPISLLSIVSLFLVTSAFALAADSKKYDVELVVTQGKKSVETDADITFSESSFTVLPNKKNFASAAKTFNYAEIKQADQSYSKKPMLSGGGAVATAILLGVFVLPFLFMKKKKHWMTVQTEKEFAVIKLGDSNYRQVVAEFETHGVKVNAGVSRRSGPPAAPADTDHDRVAGSILNPADAGGTLNIRGADAMQSLDPVFAGFLRRCAGGQAGG